MMRLGLSSFCALTILGLSISTAVAQPHEVPPHVVAETTQVTVVSEEAFAPAAGMTVARRAGAAYAFIEDESHWPSRAPLAKRLTVKVVAAIKNPTLLGLAIGQDLFQIGEAYLADPLSEGTLAHELTHVQDARELGERGANKVPHYFLEGRALAMGRAFRAKIGGSVHTGYDETLVHLLGKVTGDEVYETLTAAPYQPESKEENLLKMEGIGMLFHEWLRTAKPGRAPIQARCAHLIATVGGGKTYEEAFREEFGVTFAAAAHEFRAFVQRTEGKPEERFRGMVFGPSPVQAPPARGLPSPGGAGARM